MPAYTILSSYNRMTKASSKMHVHSYIALASKIDKLLCKAHFVHVQALVRILGESIVIIAAINM